VNTFLNNYSTGVQIKSTGGHCTSDMVTPEAIIGTAVYITLI